jgi:fermentation-respiration switch protein FrsA (DUF1100 family)
MRSSSARGSASQSCLTAPETDLRRALRLIIAIAAPLAIAYVAACAYLFVFQRDFVFKPGGTFSAPAAEGLAGVEVVTLTVRDGTRLAGWYRAAEPGRPTVLYFHGNAGNVSGRAERFRQIFGSGFGLLAMSYRGFPGSGGRPSEAGFFSDALEAFDWLAARTPEIVVHGESLGTGVATYVASEREARALVLEAPFTAALDIAAETYPWVPAALLMRDPFLSREAIRKVDEPVLILHGTADTVVPVELGKRLFEAAGEPKRLVIVEGAQHNDLWERGLWPAVLDFLQANGELEPAAGARPD